MLIILLLIVSIWSIINYHNNPVQKLSKKKVTKSIKYKERFDNQQKPFLQTKLTEPKPKFDYDDKFLYTDEDLDVIYGQNRADETHCPGENQFNDDEDDDRPIWEIVDEWNETKRFEDDEMVASDFDGVYKDQMYDIDNNPSNNKGCSDFATY